MSVRLVIKNAGIDRHDFDSSTRTIHHAMAENTTHQADQEFVVPLLSTAALGDVRSIPTSAQDMHSTNTTMGDLNNKTTISYTMSPFLLNTRTLMNDT